MSTSVTSPRPGTVTTVVVLTVLVGVLDLIAGAVTWAFASNARLQDLVDASSGTITLLAISTLVVGLVTIFVGLGLRAGSNAARMLVSIIMALRIVVSVWAIIALGSHNLTESITTLVLAVVILAMLWNSKANEFFA